MAHVIGYHRPASLDEALSMLAAPGPPKVVLAGGTSVNAGLDFEPVEVVDLQALGLDGIVPHNGRVRVGATTTLAALATSELVPVQLANLARREAPSTLRAIGTIGGLVARADPESELLAGFLVHDASVTVITSHGSNDRQLSGVLEVGPGSGIITEISFATGGVTAVARTGRTPGDRAIVAAVARRTDAGTVLTAVCGIAETPVLVEDVSSADPPADFRGTAEYRKRLAEVLTERVRTEMN